MAKKKMSKKQSRKELLKEEDAFIEAANQSIEWVDKHKNLVIFITIGLASVVALGWGAMKVLSSENSQSSTAFDEALTVLNAEVAIDESTAAPDAEPPVFATDEARLRAARVALNGVVTAGSPVADLAQFYAIDTLVKLGDQDAALKALSSLVDSITERNSLYFLAVERLAILQESMGKADEAIATYEKIRSNQEAFYRDAATYEVARIHHAAGRTDKARELLTMAKVEFPTSTMGSAVDKLLKEVGTIEAAPAPKEDKAE
jgi:tetratricopeptide (TPR) repeat protein